MKATIAAIILCISYSTHAIESYEEFTRSLMITGKMTGLCGAMDQMVRFQEVTVLENGNNFVVRFYRAEAARLGQTPEEFSLVCNDTVKLYNYYDRMINEMFKAD